MKKPFDLVQRLLLFCRRALQICESLPRLKQADEAREQLPRAAESMSANYDESEGARTPQDRIGRIVIARKEAWEARGWLRKIQTYGWLDVREDVDECELLIRILNARIISIERKISLGPKQRTAPRRTIPRPQIPPEAESAA